MSKNLPIAELANALYILLPKLDILSPIPVIKLYISSLNA